MVSVLCLLLAEGRLPAGDLDPVVEVEEDVYSYEPAHNGAGPMWCSGSTCLVRSGERVFVTGLETIPEARPLNNCRWVLLERTGGEWKRIFVDEGRTREPSPLAVLGDGRVMVSGNPTLTERDAYSGPARPELWEFAPDGSAKRTHPRWSGTPVFSEHSYRSLAVDGKRGGLIVLQNIAYDHAEWAFRNATGEWSAQGQLRWPRGPEYEPPRPVRLCYPNVAVRDRAVHFLGTGDIVEPNEAWRTLKKELSGQEWDYVFRRLYYTWTPDITEEPFRPWIELANRDPTAGHIRNCDLLVGKEGAVHVLWTERAIDERLREKFFPDARQSASLNYAILQNGTVVRRATLLASTAEQPGPAASLARFHRTPDGRVFVVMHVSGSEGGKAIAENRITELQSDGTFGATKRLPLRHPLSNFFTATPRAGSLPSPYLDLFGARTGMAHTLSYVRVKLF